MRGRMIDKDIAGEVEHLDALIGHDVESLTRLVGGESTVLPIGMPIRIDHRATKQVVFGLQPLALAIDLEHSRPMVATHMKDKLLRIGLMGRVTVNTHARHLGIFDDGEFVESREAALIKSHLAEGLVARCDAAVGKSPLVEAVWTDTDHEVLVLLPLAVI